MKTDNWTIKNEGNGVNGKKAITGIDIGLITIKKNTECIVAIIDTGVIDEKLLENSFDVVTEKKITQNADVSKHASEIFSIYETCIENAGTSIEPYSIINIKIDEEQLVPDNMIKAVQYAVDKGAKVINCSLIVNWQSDELESIIENSNVLFVFAAGNEHEEKCSYPAILSNKYENVISVAGVNCMGTISVYSNFGMNINVAAPGEDITIHFDKQELYYVSGSSYAAAYVSAIASLLAMSFPEASIIDIRNAIIDGSKEIYQLKQKVQSGGIVNLENSINLLLRK